MKRSGNLVSALQCIITRPQRNNTRFLPLSDKAVGVLSHPDTRAAHLHLILTGDCARWGWASIIFWSGVFSEGCGDVNEVMSSVEERPLNFNTSSCHRLWWRSNTWGKLALCCLFHAIMHEYLNIHNTWVFLLSISVSVLLSLRSHKYIPDLSNKVFHMPCCMLGHWRPMRRRIAQQNKLYRERDLQVPLNTSGVQGTGRSGTMEGSCTVSSQL